jgi:hypothetical protein
VRYEGVTYRKLYDYTGEVTYVLGEFYWRCSATSAPTTRLRRHGRGSGKRLNREQHRQRRRRARSSGRPARA